MGSVGRKERATQYRVVKLFSDANHSGSLGCRDLGDWTFAPVFGARASVLDDGVAVRFTKDKALI